MSGPTARSGATRAKTRPIPLGGARHRRRPQRLSVTAARTKGVERPTTQAPDGPEVLVAEAIATALDSLDVLERHTQEVADAFRWERVAEARQGLVDLVQSTQTLLKVAAIAAQTAGARLEALFGRNGSRPDEDTLAVVDLIIEQQIAGDWAALAETLDHDFTAALGQWRQVFETIGQTAPDDEPPGRAA
jgi:hypothetical protein